MASYHLKYPPTLIGECEKAIAWSEEMLKSLLASGMLKDDPDSERDAKLKRISKELGDHALTKSHGRHLSVSKVKDMGLRVVQLEDDPELQDTVLSIHHACIQTLTATNAVKIIENHLAVSFISQAQIVQQ